MGSFSLILLVFGSCNLLVDAQLGLIASRGGLSRDLLFTGSRLGDKREVPDAEASLLSKLIGEPKPTSHNARTPVTIINMESEIAAVFRAAAYGSSSTSTTTTTTSTTTTTEATTTTTTVGTTTIDSLDTTESPVILDILPNSVMEISDIHIGNKEHSNFEKYTTVISVENSNSIVLSDILNEANDQLRNNIMEHSDQSRKLVQIPEKVSSPKSVSKDRSSTDMKMMETYKIRNARYSLGAAWWIHVYFTAGLFTLLASAALCLFFRIDSVNQLFPRNMFVVLHVLVFVSAIIRCIHMFHDPYGVENRLPFSLLSLMEESSWPLMTAALAVIILAFLQATLIPNILPKCPGSKVMLSAITCVHIGFILIAHVITSLEPSSALTVAAVVRTLTASWGIAVGCVGIWCVWRFKGPVSSFHQSGLISRAIIMTFMASLAQMVLGVLQLYCLLIPASPTAQPWSWWGRMSLARGLEILIGVNLLLSVVFMTMGRKPASRSEYNIFTIFTSCVQESNGKSSRQDNIYPVQNDKIFIGSLPLGPEKMGYGDDNLIIKQLPVDLNSTLQSGISYSSISPRGLKFINPTDIQKSMDIDNIYGDKIDSRRSSMLVNDSGFLRFKTEIDSPTNLSSFSLAPSSSANIEQGFNYNNRALPNRQSCMYPQSDEYFKQINQTKGLARSNTVHSSNPNYSNKAFHSQEPVVLGSRYSVQSVDSCYSSGSSNTYNTPYHSPCKTYIQYCHNERPGVYSAQKDKRRKISQQRNNMECLGTILEPQFTEIHDGSNQLQHLNSHDSESVQSSLISNTYESNGYSYSPLDVTERCSSVHARHEPSSISTVISTDSNNVTAL